MSLTAITGAAVALPGAADPAALLRTPGPEAQPVDPASLIGKKGLRFKDRATQLGLHLAYAALTDAGLRAGTELRAPGPRIGVVVSSNLGNADTVCKAVETIAKETTSGLSPMDTPNASSNIIASEIAIRFGLGGANLTVCNGPTSGLDALRWASLLLRSHRADHVLVVGVEPDNQVTRRLVGGPVADGGAALVLARRGTGTARTLLGPVLRTATAAATVDGLAAAVPDPGLWLTADTDVLPDGSFGRTLEGWGELSGARGVVQAAAATAWFDEGHRTPAYALIGGTGLALTAPEQQR
ncbi:beta-ketoacyl synthase N-terminal-like domain-containing protein [Streptomyces sp. NPDC006514]|uniref:beta-ketoacyl synthase N-terminal-like domain-containing protein n=1 Tax=Streptomyces sp. NPDC006514 TaxID=3154308 RepID=UPI0033BDFC36